MTAPDTTTAPWTAEQVASAAGYQASPYLHPYTCPDRTDGRHRTTRDLGTLTPGPDGWTCPDCDYTQAWAATFTVDGSWQQVHDSTAALFSRLAPATDPSTDPLEGPDAAVSPP